MGFWHVMNRGVDKRSIVMSDRDRLRFVHDLFVMNDERPVQNLWYSLRSGMQTVDDVSRKRLVTIHAWCLMGNHYHLLLSEETKNGVSLFLKKLNGGYAKYFNDRHSRAGALFQGKTKRVLIKSDRQFLYILPYIHLNPLDFMQKEANWRSRRVLNPRAALTWVSEYRWSSYRNYLGENEFVAILEGSELYADRDVYVRELKRYLVQPPDQKNLDLTLE